MPSTVPPTLPPMQQVRKKMTDLQIRSLNDVTTAVNHAQEALQEQQQKATMLQALVFEYHQISTGTEVEVDPKTWELVFLVPIPAEGTPPQLVTP